MYAIEYFLQLREVYKHLLQLDSLAPASTIIKIGIRKQCEGGFPTIKKGVRSPIQRNSTGRGGTGTNNKLFCVHNRKNLRHCAFRLCNFLERNII